ncbi:MAG: YjjG family noncanonical pyrimidine nucleotidase [Bacteroidaceae bacterium]|nr:YjjG family noncanonical pyrimidine nucleotidase [Bacteroidaceae bacterium]
MTHHRNIFIDLDDTIWDFTANSHVSLEIMYRDLDIARIYPDYDAFSSAYYAKNSELWALYHHGKIEKDFLIIERYAHLLRTIGYNDIDNRLAQRMNEYYLDTLALQTQLVPYAIELLDYLTRRGYSLYILSNGFIEVQHKKLQSAGIEDYFERMVLSDEIGINKPDRRLFDYALEVTHSQAADTLMIGDNYDADILGAMQAGWGQIYFDRNHRGITAQEPQHTVHSLKEVMDIL